MHDALPTILWFTILWFWAGAPLLTLGGVAAMLLVDAQWTHEQAWRKATWVESTKGTGMRTESNEERTP